MAKDISIRGRGPRPLVIAPIATHLLNLMPEEKPLSLSRMM